MLLLLLLPSFFPSGLHFLLLMVVDLLCHCPTQVLSAAVSIDAAVDSGVPDAIASAVARARGLLSYIDANSTMLFAYTPIATVSGAAPRSGGMGLLSRIGATLVGGSGDGSRVEEPTPEQREAADLARSLSTLQWVPVLTAPPHPWMPWPVAAASAMS